MLVTYGDKIGYGRTLDDALDDIRLQRSTGSSIQLGQTTGAGASTKPSGSGTPSPSSSPSSPAGGSSSPSSPAPTPSAGSGAPTSVPQVLAQLDVARQQLNTAYDSHDPVKIGEAQKRINDLLDDYARLRSPSAKATG